MLLWTSNKTHKKDSLYPQVIWYVWMPAHAHVYVYTAFQASGFYKSHFIKY